MALAGLLVVGTALAGCGNGSGSSDSGDTGESGKSDIKYYGKVIE